MDTLDLSDFFNTKQQAQDFSIRLSQISQKIFETDFDPEASFIDHLGVQKKDRFMILMRNNNINAQSRKAIKEFIDAIQSKINSMPVLSLVLAFEPKDKTLKALAQWFVINNKRQTLFDVKVDSSIIAGAQILVNGQYLDFTVRPFFEKSFHEVIFGAAPKVADKAVTR